MKPIDLPKLMHVRPKQFSLTLFKELNQNGPMHISLTCHLIKVQQSFQMPLSVSLLITQLKTLYLNPNPTPLTLHQHIKNIFMSGLLSLGMEFNSTQFIGSDDQVPTACGLPETRPTSQSTTLRYTHPPQESQCEHQINVDISFLFLIG